MKRHLITAGILFVVIIGIIIFIATMHSSRSININKTNRIDGSHNAGTTLGTSTVISASASASPSTSPYTNLSETEDFAVVTSSTFVFPNTPIDPTTYNAKALALANLPPPRVVTTHVGSTTVTKIIPPNTGWPVTTAPYPTTGALLPFDRIIAYYGNFYSAAMGVLGQYPEPTVVAMLASTTAAWDAADPSTPTVPAIDYIAVTAQGSPGADGKYRLRMPPDQINKAIEMANQVNGIVFLDIQVGLSNVESEVPVLEPYLKLPQVELALDPEFDMHNGEKPGSVIGTMDASDINWAANYLAGLVQQYNLPPKILVVHRFTQPMVTNTAEIKPLPQVQIVMDMDGFGSPAKKMTTYQDFIASEPVQFTGVKLFYKNDASPTIGGHLMTPAEVLKFAPQPSYIQYE